MTDRPSPSPSSSPSPGTRPDWVDPALFPFESRFLEVGDHQVHYVDEGSGPVLLMLHGNPTWSFLYREVIELLRSDFRCIALDYPGFGLSVAGPGYGHRPAEHAEVVRTVVERLDLQQVTLVAHDWGGPIGVTAAEADPSRYAGLVLANTWAWPVDGDPHFEVFSRVLGGRAGEGLLRRSDLFVRFSLSVGHRRRRLTRAEKSHYLAPQSTPERRQGSAVLPRAITGERAFLAAAEAGLGRLLSLPVLLVRGCGDAAFREEELRRWQSLFPAATTVELQGAGHLVQSDVPEDFATALRGWSARALAPG